MLTAERVRLGSGLLTCLLVSSYAIALLAFATPVYAADDSNAGLLAQTPPLSPQDLSSTLNSLAQGTNDTQLQQELAQFESQLKSGDLSGAASTLVQLQNLSNSQNTPSSLKALLQSLSVGNNGAQINASQLASILNSSAGKSSNEPPQKLAVDMQTIANLMKNINPSLASQLLQNSTLLSQGAFNGAGTQGGQISLPKVTSLPNLGIPSLGAPSLSVGGPSGSIPLLSPATVAVPVLIVVIAAALFLSRNRIARLASTQDLPGVPRMQKLAADDTDLGAPPSDPRRKIEYYFGKAVRLMAMRGVPKPDHETHREFSSRLDTRPEQPQVRTISTLYEKAKFSGQEVGAPDAESAASAFFAMGEKNQ